MSGGVDIRPMTSPSTAITLKRSVRAVRRRTTRAAWLILLPPVLFILLAFCWPIAGVLYRAVEGGVSYEYLVQSGREIARWDGRDLPPAAVYQSLVADLKALDSTRVAEIAQDLNNRANGFRSLLIKTKRNLDALPAPVKLDDLVAIDQRWGEAGYWQALRAATRPFTPYYVLAALDLRQDEAGTIERAPEDRRIYLDFIWRTLWICGVVTLACAIIGYPVAFLISQASPAAEKLLLFALLVPFWTSVLVRTAAWVIVLQQNGVVNSILEWLGLISDPLTLVYNRIGVYVAMIHVLLPFTILPTYSVMKAIPRNLVPAAASLGATPFATFREVYLPLSIPGVSAGALMTFVLGLGYYVTPALVGGPGDQMESGLIARFALGEANWPMSSAIALVLLALTTLTFVFLGRALRAAGMERG